MSIPSARSRSAGIWKHACRTRNYTSFRVAIMTWRRRMPEPWPPSSRLTSGLDLAAQHRLVDPEHRRAVVRPPTHALGQALQIVRRGTLLQRHAELVAQLERQMQVLVGKVERERWRGVMTDKRARRKILDGVGV